MSGGFSCPAEARRWLARWQPEAARQPLRVLC